MKNTKQHYTQLIKNKAKELGFFYCGISKAEFLEDQAPRLESWLNKNHQGKMDYMQRNFDKRLDPRLLVDGAKSVVSLLLNYYTSEKQIDPSAPKISKYALGKDYHLVIKEKLGKLFEYLSIEIGEIGGRVFVDSAPVMDKVWAEKAGLGWIGKNSNLINPKEGSFFFIAELILDIELEPDGPIKDYCGTCTRCIDACPTDAIIAPYVIDSKKCISYLTIELKDEIIPKEFGHKMNNWMFGCDICQDVCPWNRFAKQHTNTELKVDTRLTQMKKQEWQDLTQEIFNKLFKNSAVKRTKFKGLSRNIKFLEQNM